MAYTIPIPVLPELAKDKDKLYVLKVSGNSMIKADIKDGDFVVIRPTPNLIDGAIMAVKYCGSSFVKRVRFYKRTVKLFWEDGSGTSLVTPLDNIEPQGEVVDINYANRKIPGRNSVVTVVFRGPCALKI